MGKTKSTGLCLIFFVYDLLASLSLAETVHAPSNTGVISEQRVEKE
jgi:hypothetical protein